jgi:hypothetical protein
MPAMCAERVGQGGSSCSQIVLFHRADDRKPLIHTDGNGAPSAPEFVPSRNDPEIVTPVVDRVSFFPRQCDLCGAALGAALAAALRRCLIHSTILEPRDLHADRGFVPGFVCRH